MTAQTSPATTAILRLTDIGTSLRQNATTNLVDIKVSTDAGNLLVFGSDNGLSAPPYSNGQSGSPYNFNTPI